MVYVPQSEVGYRTGNAERPEKPGQPGCSYQPPAILPLQKLVAVSHVQPAALPAVQH
jgi:hypothetical protein